MDDTLSEHERRAAIHPPGWKGWLRRVYTDLNTDRVSMAASASAFWAMLAIFPALLGVVSIYGLISDPADVERQLDNAASILPWEARRLLHDQLVRVAAANEGSLSVSALVSLGVAIWLASSGVYALMTSVGVVFEQRQDERTWVRARAIALGLTLGALFLVTLTLFLLGVLPVLFDRIGLGEEARAALSILRWPVLGLFTMLGLSVLYRFGPPHDIAKWRGITIGSVVGTTLWIAVTAVFSLYVQWFGRYDELYGAIASVVIMLLWLYLSAYSVLVGAEIDAERGRTG